MYLPPPFVAVVVAVLGFEMSYWTGTCIKKNVWQLRRMFGVVTDLNE